jgi:hypothetical protein
MFKERYNKKAFDTLCEMLIVKNYQSWAQPGEQVGIGAGGEATVKDGVATVGISGEVAVLVGAEVDLSVSVDTKKVEEDAKAAAEATQRAAEEADRIAKEQAAAAKYEADRIAAEAENFSREQAARQTAEAGNVVTRAFKKLKFW